MQSFSEVKKLFFTNPLIDCYYNKKVNGISLDSITPVKMGYLMESIIVMYGTCPMCGERSLRKYSRGNMPVVDVVCINPCHLVNNECFIYQIKSSCSPGYFDYDERSIFIGSSKYSALTHSIDASSSQQSKRVIPGYICINYTKKNSSITINLNRSFVLIPDYHRSSGKYYGLQCDYGRKTKITWFSNVKTFSINRVLYGTISSDDTKIVDMLIPNPYQPLAY